MTAEEQIAKLEEQLTHVLEQLRLKDVLTVNRQERFGVKIASLNTYLRTVMRLPVRQIQAYLASLHGLSISSGEIIGLAQRIKAQMEPQLAEVKPKEIVLEEGIIENTQDGDYKLGDEK